jgi:hypothetical protein
MTVLLSTFVELEADTGKDHVDVPSFRLGAHLHYDAMEALDCGVMDLPAGKHYVTFEEYHVWNPRVNTFQTYDTMTSAIDALKHGDGTFITHYTPRMDKEFTQIDSLLITWWWYP